jgi:hypothetical protein
MKPGRAARATDKKKRLKTGKVKNRYRLAMEFYLTESENHTTNTNRLPTLKRGKLVTV